MVSGSFHSRATCSRARCGRCGALGAIVRKLAGTVLTPAEGCA